MTQFEWMTAFFIAVVSIARLTRLFTWDTYPPTAWLRAKWRDFTNDGPWSVLMECGYCFGLYAGLFVVGTGGLSIHLTGDLHWTWWAFNIWMAASYLGSILMAFDGEVLD
jgi:hypothetical protein